MFRNKKVTRNKLRVTSRKDKKIESRIQRTEIYSLQLTAYSFQPTVHSRLVTRHSSLVTTKGFTLLEALLSITILAIVAISLSYSFTVGFKANEDKVKNLEKSSYARGMMELINAVDFSMAASGSDTVTVEGETVTRTWTVTPFDMDGDSVPETDANKVTVAVDDVTLDSIIIDSNGLVTMKR